MKFQDKGKYSRQYPLQAHMLLEQVTVSPKLWQFIANVLVGCQERVK